MTISHRTLMVVAISVLGLAGWKSQAAGRSSEADEQAVEKPADAETPKLLLLTDGRIQTGVISEEDGMVVVTQSAGVMKFPERKVVRAFDSIQEIHQYKLEQVPEGDMDEQLKLAQWCMSNDLVAEAQGHLENILKIDPKHGRAQAMVASIKMTEQRMAANRRRDTEVKQTGAEVVEPGSMERPAALDNAVVRGARRGMGVSDLPIVFDLPPGAALKRADEFKNYVHPIVQTYCAKCHNDRYEGAFHLIGFKTKVERTPDTLRANLDAVLRLVDRENPGRSELLASSLRPHGKAPTRPIFQGSNDKAYQILAAWVNNLHVKPAPAAAAADSGPAATGGRTEDFAVGRTRISRGTVEVEPVAGGPVVGGPFQPSTTVIPPTRYTPDKGFVDDSDADPNDAPLPFAVTGVKPKLPPRDGEPEPATATPAARPKAARPAAPTASGIPSPLSADQAAAAIEAGAGEDDEPIPAAKKPAKKLKLDPALLERALQLKNGRR